MPDVVSHVYLVVCMLLIGIYLSVIYWTRISFAVIMKQAKIIQQVGSPQFHEIGYSQGPSAVRTVELAT